ncbi:acyltransferase family protein [Rothia sp. CCM 9416]|uniref:acyltransferase family protein n=1 Tax=Rothia sp. CCM 9416 TaxID=3402655 RepID=UPI003ADBD513
MTDSQLRQHRAPSTGTIRTVTLQAERAWRPEIQGLRALALLLVAAYHLWFGRVSGGVDVFLLISAFLLTGSFTRKLEEGKILEPGSWWGAKTLLAYWVHVFKRLLPLASITVLLTLLGTYFFIPAERWLPIIDEAKSVVLYQHNYWSIENAVDYYAADSSQASPFRHFWSLSVQGQMYVLWPLIFLLLALPLGKRRRWARWLLTLAFGLIFALSLSYSIDETAAHQTTAYFNTQARLWEFALGSLVALWLPALKLPRHLRALMGWAGLAGLVSCGFVLDVNGTFPGYVALWPTLCAALVIMAGDTGTLWGPEKLLTWRPLLALGGFSYALYLVHWPILIFYLSQTKEAKAGFVAGLVLLLISGLLAWALTKAVEQPLRDWAWPNRSIVAGFVTATLFAGLALAPSYAWTSSIYRQAVAAEEHRATNNVGAAMLDSTYEYTGDEDATVIPIRAVLDADWADLGPSCTEAAPELDLPEYLERDCNFVVQTPNPTGTVVAWGNSHTQMWITALRPLAAEEGWNLIALTRPGCFLGEEDNEAYSNGFECQEWAEESSNYIQQLHPDIVILQGTKSEAELPDTVLANAEQRIEELTHSDIRVIGVRDTPRMETMHKDCLDSFGTFDECTMDPGQDVFESPLTALEGRYPGFAALNLSDLVCPNNECPASIGNIYTYFDYDHLTATYIETLGPYFDPRLLEAVHRADQSAQTAADDSAF